MARDGRSPGTAPSRAAGTALAGLVLALAALTAVVRSGDLNVIDQFGLDHLMPGLHPAREGSPSLAGLYLPFTGDTSWWAKLLGLWTYPCSVLVSGVVVTVAAVIERRRGRGLLALAPVAAWVAGNGIEVIGKHVIVRPHLYGAAEGVRIHIRGFDDSFPSGHMTRCVIVTWAILLVWRRAARWLAVWAALVGPALVVTAAHTVTDVVGGMLTGPIAVLLGTTVAGWLARAPAWVRR